MAIAVLFNDPRGLSYDFTGSNKIIVDGVVAEDVASKCRGVGLDVTVTPDLSPEFVGKPIHEFLREELQKRGWQLRVREE